jgi:multidrug efflux pump
VTVRRKEAEALLATVEFEFASVDSAELQPGSGLADALRAALARYDDTWGPKLFFTGHTDDVSVGRGLATTLATDLGGPVTVGKAGNLPLSVARARRVCRYVREEVGIPVDCNAPGVVSGMGFSQPLPGNNPDRNRRVDIRVRYPRDDRGLRAMDELRISTSQGMVPLRNFVKIEPAPGVDTLSRVDGIPVELIRADVVDGVLADTMVRRIESWLGQQDFDPAIKIRFRGANEEQADSMAFVGVAFLLALALMFILLVTQFNSFYQSALIMLAVVMSTAGVLLGLLILGNPFSAILTGVGVVALAGIVVNNNIILIDTFNHVRRMHPELDTRAVIVRATAQRLRPVLLTTVTTVFGLLPLACGLSVDLISRSITANGEMALFWAPLSQAIVFGLSFATVLTLVATPAMLALPVTVREFLERYRSQSSPEPQGQPQS